LSLNIDDLVSIFDDYLTIQNSLKITRRSLSEKTPLSKNRTIFDEMKYSEAEKKLKTAKKEFSNLIVLSLFAQFERQLRDEIAAKSSKLLEIIPIELAESLNQLTQKEMERWRIEEVIDLFKFAVDGNLRGQMKQILEYRNWLAHGRNVNKLPSIRKADPQTTFDSILGFITQIQHYYQHQ